MTIPYLGATNHDINKLMLIIVNIAKMMFRNVLSDRRSRMAVPNFTPMNTHTTPKVEIHTSVPVNNPKCPNPVIMIRLDIVNEQLAA